MIPKTNKYRMSRTEKTMAGFALLGYLLAAFFLGKSAPAAMREPGDYWPPQTLPATEVQARCELEEIRFVHGGKTYVYVCREEIGVDRNGAPVGP